MALRTVILSPGECATFPNNSSIKTIVIDGDATISSSTCGNLPTPVGYVCYKFEWEDDNSGSMQDAYFESLVIGSNTYNVPPSYNDFTPNLIDALTGQTIAAWMNTDPQFEGLVKVGCAEMLGDPVVKIQIPEGLPVPYFKVVNPWDGNAKTMTFNLLGILDTDCENCS